MKILGLHIKIFHLQNVDSLSLAEDVLLHTLQKETVMFTFKGLSTQKLNISAPTFSPNKRPACNLDVLMCYGKKDS